MAIPTYFDFDLLIEKIPRKYQARVLSSPSGQASAMFGPPLTGMELENFYLKVGRPRKGIRRIDSSEMEAAKKVGGRLFESIIKDDIYNCFYASLIHAQNEGKGLRIKLRLSAPELNELPWEYLYNSSTRNFLSLSVGTPIVRYIDLPHPPKALEVTPPLRMLAMISSPTDYPFLDTQIEWEKLQKAVNKLTQKGLLKLEKTEKATLTVLQRHLRQNEYHIFHFIGHGGFDHQQEDGVLVFEDENRRGRILSGQYLGTILHNHPSLRLVVLNACEGARTTREDPFSGTAQSLVQQGIPAIVAMQFEITDQAAIIFAEEFYSALADGYPLDAALSETRTAIFATGNDIEWGTPVCFTRAPNGNIFSIEQPSKISHRYSQFNEKNLEEIYFAGLRAYIVKDWEKATSLFEEIFEVNQNYEDVLTKLEEIRQIQATEQNLRDLYKQGLRATASNSLLEAKELFEKIQKIRHGYLDTEQLLQNLQAHSSTSENGTPQSSSEKHPVSKSSIQNIEPVLFDSLPSTISVETEGGISTPILYKGTSLPVHKKEVYSTASDNQAAVDIHLVWGENRRAKDNVSLGRFQLDKISPQPKGMPKVEIQFEVSRNLSLIVTARDKVTDNKKSFSVIELAAIDAPPTIDPLPEELNKGTGSTTDLFNTSNDFSDMFRTLFGSTPDVKTTTPMKGSDIQLPITLTFNEAALGIEKPIEFSRNEVCSNCQGSGKVSNLRCFSCSGTGRRVAKLSKRVLIPAGVDSGTQIRLVDQGDQGLYGGSNGHLFLILNVAAHPLFQRVDFNLLLTYPVSINFANQGGTLQVPTLIKGENLKLMISKNTHNQQEYRIKGKGIAHLREKKKGDMIIRIETYNPREIAEDTKNQLRLIKQYL
jgi:DnaJ-class molecular chaperone/tetratricopeptide (TPR) repeat protein